MAAAANAPPFEPLSFRDLDPDYFTVGERYQIQVFELNVGERATIVGTLVEIVRLQEQGWYPGSTLVMP
jgi:hypothetical protein